MLFCMLVRHMYARGTNNCPHNSERIHSLHQDAETHFSRVRHIRRATYKEMQYCELIPSYIGHCKLMHVEYNCKSVIAKLIQNIKSPLVEKKHFIAFV
jgi:hypothetical protein